MPSNKESERVGQKKMTILPRVNRDQAPWDPDKARSCLKLERRILKAAFALGLFSSLLFIVAICSESWVKVEYEMGVLSNDTEKAYYKTGHYQGLWRICSEEYYNETVRTNMQGKNSMRDEYCFALHTYLSAENKEGYLDTITHYRRSCCAIGVLGLLISLVAHVATGYSLFHMRYIYKRLAGVLHLITGVSAWVTVEVFKQSMNYERDYLELLVPHNATIGYGFAYYLGWICFGLFLLSGIVLLICSRKRKGVRARSQSEAQDNEPVNIGRI